MTNNIVIAFPTTPERAPRVLNAISFVQKNSDYPYSIFVHTNLLGGWVKAVREMMTYLKPDQLVCVLGDDCEVTPNWLKILVETYRENFWDRDGIVQPDDCTGRNGGIASFPVCTAQFLLDWAYSGYTHNFCDEEMALTAMSRKKYIYVPKSVVNHRHHSNTEGIVKDATYQLEDQSANGDRELFQQRANLSGNFKYPERLDYD